MKIVLTRREALDTPDGINIFLFTLAEALIHRGHQVTVLSSASSDPAKIRNYYPLQSWPEVRSLGQHTSVRYGRSLAAWLSKGRRAIRELRPDMVIVNGAVPVRLDSLTCTVSHDAERRMDGIPYFREGFKRFCYRKSDLVVATCDEVRKALSVDLRMPEHRIAVIPTCVKLSSYINEPPGRREQAILHIGTVDYKNPLGSLEAFAAMKHTQAKLYITGKVTPPLQSAVVALPKAIRTRIELLGFISSERLVELQGKVKVVSVPSDYVAPVASPTVIEALASGTPVVASTSISRQVLIDGVNGFVRPSAPPEKFAAAFDALMSDEGMWQSMSSNASKTAEQFSADRVAELYLALGNSKQSPAGAMPLQVVRKASL